MSNEKKEQILVYLRLFIMCICAGLYAWGGMEHRLLLRRILAPLIATITAFAITRDKRTLAHFPLLWGASSLGYGASAFWIKVFKRFYVGLAFGLSSNTKNMIDHRWLISGFFTVLCIAAFICFGVFNPFFSARVEETMLGLIIYLPILSLRRK